MLATFWMIALLMGTSTLCFGGDAYPNRPVRWIVSVAAGGSTDLISRVIARKLTEAWGVEVVVDNRPGAGGTIGLAGVANATPDGYTITLAQLSNVALAPTFYRQLTYDPIRSLTPITLAAKMPMIVVAHPSLGVHNLRELIALARSTPHSITFGSASNGSIGHLAGEMLEHMSRIEMTHVPYKGGSQAITALIGGQISLGITAITSARPLISNHRLIPLGVTSGERSPAIPDVPTIAEAGIDGYDVFNWYGVMAPGGTDKSLVARINAGVIQVLKRREVRDRLANEGGQVLGSTPEAFGAFIRSEIAKWATVIKGSGAKVE